MSLKILVFIFLTFHFAFTNQIANLGTLKLVGVRLIALALQILLESTSNGA